MAVSATHEHALKVLADGKWYPYEWALYEVAKGVPPQHARQRAERDRVQQYAKDHGIPKHMVPPRTRWGNMDQVISVGSRGVARDVLRNAAFEHAKHTETGQRIVRLMIPGMVTPPPPDYEFYHFAERSTRAGKTAEQLAKEKSEAAKRAHATLLRNRGLDPATHVTKTEQRARRRAEREAMTPEERNAYHQEIGRKAAETRMRQQGLDPAKHKTRRQLQQERSERYAAMTPEERKAHHHEKALKAAATRRARQKEK